MARRNGHPGTLAGMALPRAERLCETFAELLEAGYSKATVKCGWDINTRRYIIKSFDIEYQPVTEDDFEIDLDTITPESFTQQCRVFGSARERYYRSRKGNLVTDIIDDDNNYLHKMPAYNHVALCGKKIFRFRYPKEEGIPNRLMYRFCFDCVEVFSGAK